MNGIRCDNEGCGERTGMPLWQYADGEQLAAYYGLTRDYCACSRCHLWMQRWRDKRLQAMKELTA